MSETSQESTPIVLNDSNLELKSFWPNVVSVSGIDKEKVETTIKIFPDLVAYGDSRKWDDENKAITQRQKQSFIENELPLVLKGEQQAFREMRFSIRNELGKIVLILADNLDYRKVGENGLKGWLLEVITQKEASKNTN